MAHLGPDDPRRGRRLFRAAVAGGARLFDVGSYNMGPHEEGSETDVLFGAIARDSGLDRDAWQLCWKLWLWTWPAEPLAVQLDRLEKRAGYDHAELAILGDFVGELDVERVVGEVGELLAPAGSAPGAYNWSAQDIARADDAARAAGLPGPALAQLKYSICRRSVAEGAPWRALIDERGIAIQATDVFEGGILAGGAADGAGSDGHRRDPRADPAAAPALAAIARDEFGATPGSSRSRSASPTRTSPRSSSASAVARSWTTTCKRSRSPPSRTSTTRARRGALARPRRGRPRRLVGHDARGGRGGDAAPVTAWRPRPR